MASSSEDFRTNDSLNSLHPDINIDSNGKRHPNDSISRLKRTACILCRKRKLKCDGARPACATCSRLGHDCKYDEVRKKSGPKRGYVKALEARLAQVETMLKTTEGTDSADGGRNQLHASIQDLSTIGMADPADLSTMDQPDIMSAARVSSEPGPSLLQPTATFAQSMEDVDETFPFDLIATGLEEPLPTPVIMSQLNEMFFQKVYPSLPIIHKARYFAAMDLAPSMRPPVCLRYAMWSLAAATSDKYESFHPHFYQRARKYLEKEEMRGFGQSILTMSHCQSWFMVAMYEFRNMFFPRAWMSTGRAIRLTQMLSLHRLDGAGLDVKLTIAPPRDWTEREERRRTFWLIYWADRCASIGTGWPMSFEEKDILTNLPASDEAFQSSHPTRTQSLTDALQSMDQDFSSISGSIIMATLFGRNLTHLHRPEPDDREEDLNGKFWQRHRAIDATLLNIKLTMPQHLRIPLGINDPNVVFLNMCLHSSAICLHQAAIYKAERNHLPSNVAGESKMRCIAAASEIATIMRTASHLDLVQMNPFIAFCLYVAARVFVQFLRARPNEQQVSSSLQFLLTAMHAMTQKNPLTESFIAQLELDMDSAGINNPINKSGLQSVVQRGVPEYQNVQCSSFQGCGPSQGSQWNEVNLSHQDEPSSLSSSNGKSNPAPSFPSSSKPFIFAQRPQQAQFSHTHASGVLPDNLETERQRQGTPDAMNLTPDDSASGTGSGSASEVGHHTRQQWKRQLQMLELPSTTPTISTSAFTPPQSEAESGIEAHSKHKGAGQRSMSQDVSRNASPPDTSYAFSDPSQFEPSMFASSGESMRQLDALDARTLQSFLDFNAPGPHFMPGYGDGTGSTTLTSIPGLQDSWNDSRGGPVPGSQDPGFTSRMDMAAPAFVEDPEEWEKVLQTMSGWEGGEPLVAADPWSFGMGSGTTASPGG